VTVGLDPNTSAAYVNMLGYGACVFASPPCTSIAQIPQLVFTHLAARLPSQVMQGVLKDEFDLAAGADVSKRVHHYAEDGSTISTRDDVASDCSQLQAAFLRKAAPLLPALSASERAALASSDEAVFLAAASRFIERIAARPRIVIELDPEAELPVCVCDREIDVVVAHSNVVSRYVQRVGTMIDPHQVEGEFAIATAQDAERAWRSTIGDTRFRGRRLRIEWPEGYGTPAPAAQVHGLEWFLDDRGFDENFRAALLALPLGGVHESRGATDLVRVTRIDDIEA
jgi:hypothetical protein